MVEETGYQQHAELTGPPEGRIWRYLDLWKFIDLLRTRELYHANIATLEDRFEGSITPLDDFDFEALGARMTRDGVPEGSIETMRGYSSQFRRSAWVSCWNRLDHVNLALWNLYARTGVAVVSSVERLRSAVVRPEAHLANASGNGLFALAGIRYVDHSVGRVGVEQWLARLTAKRIEFSFESEVRSIVFAFPSWGGEDIPIKAGVSVEVDVARLIDRVVVSPHLPPAAFDAVEAICSSMAPGTKVIRSEYAGKPIY